MSAAIIFETDGEVTALRPDEIADEDIISQAVNCKSSLTLRIYPTFEAWQTVKRQLTYVTVYDLDKPSDRIVFEGRVATYADSMDSSGRLMQEVTCVSAADYLEDTEHTGYNGYGWIPATDLSVWLPAEVAKHNTAADTARQIACTVTGAARVYSKEETLYKTRWETISEVLTGGKYLSKAVTEGGETTYIPNYTMEWRERYTGGAVYIDVAESFGEHKDTAINLGENLKDIKVERNLDGGIYTAVLAVSGVNADGYRATKKATNAEMAAIYGTGRTLVLTADDIRFTGKGGRYYNSVLARWEWLQTPATLAMEAALQTFAEQEAAKLSDPPVKITLNAVDLARLGLAGYDGFEVGNTHPVVCPPLGLFGEDMRITEIKRRLASGQIASITIEKGQKPAGRTSDTLSQQLAKLDELNRQISDSSSQQVQIAQTKVNEQTDDFVFKQMTPQEYEDLPSTSPLKTHGFCIVRNPLTDETKLYINGENISSGGGEEYGEIEYAVVLTEEQTAEWIPEHAMVPVWFRGQASVYYGGIPSRIVVQGQKVIFGSPSLAEKPDIMSSVTLELAGGYVERYDVEISRINTASVFLRLAAYDVTSTETLIGRTGEVEIYATDWMTMGLTVGVVLCTTNFQSLNNKIAPVISMYFARARGTLVTYASTAITLPSGSHFSNPVPMAGDAERDFALTLTTRTEPVAPA